MRIGNLFNREPPPPKLERELRPEELREKMRDPNFLPTREDIFYAFKPEGHDVGKWRDFCFDKKNPVFEFLNQEFITAVSNHFARSAQSLGASKDTPVTILEVGAGNGRLSHFLQQKLDEILPGKVNIIATDSGKLGLKTDFPVETIGHKKALEKYRPQIVVFSWMPYEVDVTNDFRTTRSVNEYILIGETNGQSCGDEWLTWGKKWPLDRDERKNIPPYIVDGFDREDLNGVGIHQISRMDDLGRRSYSGTVSFKRKK